MRTVAHMTSTPPLDPSGQRRSQRSLKGRTSLVTAAAIAGVLVAGTAAVAANIGILNAADSSAIGDLAATDELLPAAGAEIPTVTVGQQAVPSTTAAPSTTTAPAGGAQQYDIENTGTVWVLSTTSGLALDHVVAETGWNPVLTQSDLRSLQVDFINGDRTIVFTAALADDGSVVVDVTEPTTVIGAAPIDNSTQIAAGATPVPTTAYYDDDHYDDDDYDDDDYDDDDDHDDDDHDDDEHEGADDDD